MEFSNIRKLRAAITVLLLLLFLFANIYAIRQMMRLGRELFFYDKMLVAYQVGGLPGVEDELERVLSQNEAPREMALARAFKQDKDNLESTNKFLTQATENLKKKITLFRNLRNLAFGLIIVVLILRLALNLRIKKNQ